MSREDDLKILYTAPPQEPRMQVFNSIQQPCPILAVLSIDDVVQLNRIAKDKKLNSKPKEKMIMIKTIMERRGFKKLAAGTNRIVFKYMENQSFVIKVAYDSVGLGDNLREIYNQHFLKPFCTKVFEVSPCGTVGMFERVHVIKNREEFYSISSEIYDIIVMQLIGRYVIDDFGTKFFMNWGVREGMHPVLLDFPYCYELDGAKLYCNAPNPSTGFCGGEIDYDDGFNHLVCTKCGKQYLASELRRALDGKSDQIIIEKEDIEMIVTIIKDGKELVNDTSKESTRYRKMRNGKPVETPYEYRKRKKYEGLEVSIIRGSDSDQPISNDADNQQVESSDYTQNYGRQINVNFNTGDNTFNENWRSTEVPAVDDMYKDIEVSVIRGQEKKKKNVWKNIPSQEQNPVNIDEDLIKWPGSEKQFKYDESQQQQQLQQSQVTEVQQSEPEYKENLAEPVRLSPEDIEEIVADKVEVEKSIQGLYDRAKQLVQIEIDDVKEEVDVESEPKDQQSQQQEPTIDPMYQMQEEQQANLRCDEVPSDFY